RHRDRAAARLRDGGFRRDGDAGATRAEGKPARRFREALGLSRFDIPNPNSMDGAGDAPVSHRRKPMRFMVMVKATQDSEAGAQPTQELLEAMMAYNEELVKAGIMKGGDGLQPSSKGARVQFDGAKRAVVDDPFAETKELVA